MKDADSFDAVIRQLVSGLELTGFGGGSGEISTRVGVLERLFERWRIQNRILDNAVRFEDFLGANAEIRDGRICVSRNKLSGIVGSGTSPYLLQPWLLLFLLLHHRWRHSVYEIIDLFVRTMWDQLAIVDFKRTRTGVLRCHTNTRFAGATLRNYGLLRFTRVEAYKTWVLSLPGFVVAARIFRREHWWSVEKSIATEGMALHPDIAAAREVLGSYDLFVGELAHICEPNTEVFRTFHGVLHVAYQLLVEYWDVLNNRLLSADARIQKTRKLIAQLEQTAHLEDFERELSKCLNVEALLREFQ